MLGWIYVTIREIWILFEEFIESSLRRGDRLDMRVEIGEFWRRKSDQRKQISEKRWDWDLVIEFL